MRDQNQEIFQVATLLTPDKSLIWPASVSVHVHTLIHLTYLHGRSLPGSVLIHLTYLHDRSLPGSVLIHLTYLHDRSLPGSVLIPLTYLHGMSLPGSVLIHLTYCLAWYRIFNKNWHLYWMLKCEMWTYTSLKKVQILSMKTSHSYNRSHRQMYFTSTCISCHK